MKFVTKFEMGDTVQSRNNPSNIGIIYSCIIIAKVEKSESSHTTIEYHVKGIQGTSIRCSEDDLIKLIPEVVESKES